MRDDKLELTPVQAAGAFAALGSEQRLHIIETLVRAGPDGLATGELGERTGIGGSTLTHHLKILTTAGLVQQQRHGRSIVCAAVSFATVETLSGFLLRNCCLDADGYHTDDKHSHV